MSQPDEMFKTDLNLGRIKTLHVHFNGHKLVFKVLLNKQTGAGDQPDTPETIEINEHVAIALIALHKR